MFVAWPRQINGSRVDFQARRPHWALVTTDANAAAVEVFHGSRANCVEYGLVLEAKGLGYGLAAAEGAWTIVVAPAVAEVALDELRRYDAERVERRESSAHFVPFAGGGLGAGMYVAILVLVSYSAGIDLFGANWLQAGAIVSQPEFAAQWWRAVTALTLHLDQEHLLGNLLFGAGAGMLVGRMFGPGVGWLGILAAGAVANYLDMRVSPGWHRAVGASTAVFAALGLLAGFGWGQRLRLRTQRLIRWGPLFAGVCLLALLGAGAGDQHVDVLGHVLGFTAGVGLGWVFARLGVPSQRSTALQFMAGGIALILIGGAWALALQSAL